MTISSTRGEGLGGSLAAYQREFVEAFLDQSSPQSRHLLLGPVGSGKSFCAAVAIARRCHTDDLHYVLVIAPRPLTTMWSEMLDREGMVSVALDGKELRLLKHQYTRGLEPWPAGAIVLSVDLAAREDVRAVLTEVSWDLVVVDDADGLSPRQSRLIEELSAGKQPPALLLVATTRQSDWKDLLGTAHAFDWEPGFKAYKKQWEASTGHALRTEVVVYSRTPEEIHLVRRLEGLASKLEEPRRSILVSRAMSSTSSLESTLYRWLEDGNISHVESRAVEDIQVALEEMGIDSRGEAFEAQVQVLADAGVQHAVAFCEFQDTVHYVAALTGGTTMNDLELTAALSAERRKEVLRRFQVDGGLLITTTAASEGLSLGIAGAVLHFDLPLNSDAFAVRQGRYDRFGRRTPCRVIFFRDEKGAFPQEEKLLSLFGAGS